MKPQRRQRLLLVVYIVTATSLAVGLLAYALRDNLNHFYTPAEIADGSAPVGPKLRVGGMVVADSVSEVGPDLQREFQLSDGLATVRVRYTGILPDLFAEDEAAVAVGRMTDAGVFEADQVLAKHDEQYTPPEVADAMQQAHERQRSGTTQTAEQQ